MKKNGLKIKNNFLIDLRFFVIYLDGLSFKHFSQSSVGVP